MKVFLLLAGTNEDMEVRGVFASVEDAVKYANPYNNIYGSDKPTIEEWELGGGGPLNWWTPVKSNPNIWEKR